jgi:hypothetical protein
MNLTKTDWFQVDFPRPVPQPLMSDASVSRALCRVIEVDRSLVRVTLASEWLRNMCNYAISICYLFSPLAESSSLGSLLLNLRS